MAMLSVVGQPSSCTVSFLDTNASGTPWTSWRNRSTKPPPVLQLELIQSFVLLLLASYVLADHRFVTAHRGHEVSSRPEIAVRQNSTSVRLRPVPNGSRFCPLYSQSPATPNTSAVSRSSYARGHSADVPLRFGTPSVLPIVGTLRPDAPQLHVRAIAHTRREHRPASVWSNCLFDTVFFVAWSVASFLSHGVNSSRLWTGPRIDAPNMRQEFAEAEERCWDGNRQQFLGRRPGRGTHPSCLMLSL